MFPLRQTRPCLALPPGSAHPSPSSCGNFQTFQHSNLSTFRQPIRSSLATAPLTPFPATLSGESQLIENPAALSPVLATLTRHIHLNPFVCHFYKKHRGGGYTLQPAISFRNLTTRHSPLTTKSFAIRSSIKPAHKLFRINTYKKTGGRGPAADALPHYSLFTTHYPLPTAFYGIRRILCSFSFALPDNFCSSFKPPMPQLARIGRKHSSRDCSILCGYKSDSRYS